MKQHVNDSVDNRPTFINVGPGRCATSWLHEILTAHPQITMARVKETEFFNSNFRMGTKWYESQFPKEGKHVRGEISNCYYLEPAVVDRIRNYDPNMRIMINLRDPYSLIQSFHRFGIRRGLQLDSLQHSLEVPIGKLMGSGFNFRDRRGCLNQGDRVSLLDSVMLSNHIRPFLEAFPQKQIYFFVFERLESERAAVLAEIYDFLDVDSTYVPQSANKIVNAAIAPKSKWVAQAATNFSYLLRRFGAYGLLTRLHQSKLIKKCFYSDVRQRAGDQADPRQILDDETRFLLDEEIKNMILIHPPLADWWSELPFQDLSESNAATAGSHS